MDIILNKQDFEKAIPVGTSSSDQVFEMIYPLASADHEFYSRMLLGDAGMTLLDKEGEEGDLCVLYKKFIYQEAFLAMMRQLDLVLTPTGFGVVNNENVSPASQARVDALEKELRTQHLKTRALLVDSLRSPEWGASTQALIEIQWLYGLYQFFIEDNPNSTYLDWDSAKKGYREADLTLTGYIGRQFMDVLIEAYRKNDKDTLNNYSKVISLCRNIFQQWPDEGANAMKSPAWHMLMAELDSDADKYKVYVESNAYHLTHFETFKNDKHKSGFIFNG